MNGNRWQLQGPGGQTPQLTAGVSPQTFFFNLRGLPAKYGNDFLYADSIRVRVYGPLALNAAQAVGPPAADPFLYPNRQCLANLVRQCRVYSPLLGELYPRKATYGTFLVNHDMWFDRRFKRTVPEQLRTGATLTTDVHQAFVDLEFPFERDYGVSPDDFTPLMALLEGGQLEVDLAPATALIGTDIDPGNYWTMGTGANAWSCRASIQYHHDSQLVIHVPTQKRLYEQTLSAPSFELQNVGAPQGLDGVISGSRIAVMSWLGAGRNNGGEGGGYTVDPCQFYVNAAPGSGVNFAQQGLQRMDIPWRDQRSVIDVQSWIQDFLSDIKRNPTVTQADAQAALSEQFLSFGLNPCDLSGFPFAQDITTTIDTGFNFGANIIGDPLLNPALTFWPMVWPSGEGSKIADMMMADGTLQFSADFADAPSSRAYRFRTDEVTMFTPEKIMDLMDALQTPHQARGGSFVYVPKYDGARMGSARTAAFLPQKIVPVKAVK